MLKFRWDYNSLPLLYVNTTPELWEAKKKLKKEILSLLKYSLQTILSPKIAGILFILFLESNVKKLRKNILWTVLQ